MEKSPDAFRTISEVAEVLDVPQHVLRFWETKFTQIKPLKRAGGRRFYRPGDIELIRGIQSLLYGDGYTIKGVQRIIRDQGIRFVMDTGRAKFSGEELVAPEMELATGKADLPIATPRKATKARATAAPGATPDAAPEVSPEVAVGLTEAQSQALTRVLGELKDLRAKMVAAKASAQLESDAPLFAQSPN